VFTRTGLPGERQVYRTSGSLVAWWAWLAFAVVLLMVLAFGHRDHAALVTASVVVVITGIMYACALRPRIVADAAGVTVVNPLRVHEVPWPAVAQVDLVQNVRVHYRSPGGGTPGADTRDGSPPGREKIVHSWAVQSTGRSKTRSELRARRAARRGTAPEPGYARLPDAAQAALAGSAAEFIARQLDERARVQNASAGGPASAGDAGPGQAPDAAPAIVRVRWSWGPIAAMVVPLLILLALTLA
jgi:Bacterial PH domain